MSQITQVLPNNLKVEEIFHVHCNSILQVTQKLMSSLQATLNSTSPHKKASFAD